MFERVFTIGLPNGSGPDVDTLELNLPDHGGPYLLEAWASKAGGSNVHILRGALSVVQATDLIERGLSDVIMTVPAAGVGKVLLSDTAQITVFFEANNNSGQFELVTVRVFK